MKINKQKKSNSFFSRLGPGIITGASDDDPSGILTYIQTGTVLGVNALWTALLTLPLMYGIQEMCGRIGLITGKGLIRLIKENYPRFILYPIAIISIIVIILNIGADLVATGIVLERITSINQSLWVVLVSGLIIFFTVRLSYKKFASVLKWLTLSLMFYVIAVFFLNVDWSLAFAGTILPGFKLSAEGIILITAVFGTTISPYLFFWQTSEEVEERNIFHDQPGKKGLKLLRQDTFFGMLFSNVVMWFIIAGASHLGTDYGISQITDFQQASLVLKPLLGNFAFFVFSLGIIGTTLLVVPILAGSVGYALAEIYRWKEGINRTFSQARGFYIAIITATLIGLAISFFGFDPVRLLIKTAVLYALITPPLIYIIMKIGNDKKIMGLRTNSKLSNTLGVLALISSLSILILYFSY